MGTNGKELRDGAAWERLEDKRAKMIDAARMYYDLDYSQADIARRIGVSRPTISRFLRQAKEEGVVQIRIVDPRESNEALAGQLESRFGLKKAIVVSVPQYDAAVVRRYIGEAAARYVGSIVRDGDMIGVTWGTTLYEVAQHLQDKHVKNVKVVQLNGGVSHSATNTYAHEVVHLFGKAFHTTPYFLPLPAILDHEAVKEAIESDRHIRNILELGKQTNVAVITVGSPTEDSVLINANYFTEKDLAVIHRIGAGDICSRYIDIDGKLCDESMNRRTIGISLEELGKKEYTVLVAGGARKADGICGALRGRYANVLITDQVTANYVLARGG